jgi:glycosyltransferase involved in cell wall biosynthesis
MNLTVVIISKNEVSVIAETIRAAQKLTDAIIVVDTGSTDGTVELLEKLNVQIIKSDWLGFGPTKNLGIAHAKTDWILSLDADERMDDTLCSSIEALTDDNANRVYSIPFLNYFGDKPLHYGEWGGDVHIRIFNKHKVQWNNNEVHEKLILDNTIILKKLKGFIHHRTVSSLPELQQKMEYYARLNAKHYLVKGKKNAAIRVWVSPLFNLVSNYFFKLGFLDGKVGWLVAKENARYTYKKYLYLQQLQKQNNLD